MALKKRCRAGPSPHASGLQEPRRRHRPDSLVSAGQDAEMIFKGKQVRKARPMRLARPIQHYKDKQAQ
eukprot:6191420-Pleurochrysis_carterae.AAC.1